MTNNTLLAVVLCALGTPPQLPPPAGALETLVETRSAPGWIALPPHGQLQVPFGTKFELVHAAVVSRSKPREAVLVGALRNRGGDMANVAVALHYFDGEGKRLQPIAPNVAAVSWAAAGGLLPFRFPLAARDQLSGRAVLYRLVVDTEVRDVPLQVESARVELAKTRSLGPGGGVSVTGVLDFGAGGNLPPADAAGLTLTLLLMDGSGRVLDVIAERPFRSGATSDPAGRWRFEVRTVMPVTSPVHDVRAWLADAAIHPGR